MGKNRREVREAVLQRIHKSTLNSIKQFVENKDPKLWGQTKEDAFVDKSVEVALYKDAYAVGYTQLAKEIKRWFPLPPSTLQHNMKKLRRLFGDWGEDQIVLGSLEEWKQAASAVQLPPEVKNASLWIDSSDFRLKGKRFMSRKSRHWSYKLNAPGRRYMFLCDGKGRIRKIWGGYSPKVYDGHFIETRKKWFEQKLAGAEVIADQHFRWGQKHLRQVKFHVAKPEPHKRGKRKRKDDEVNDLTEQERKYNKAVKKTRARVETAFGKMSKKFDALNHPWYESESQLDHLVLLASGVVTFEVGKTH
jgi:hypothetical protein